MFCEYCGEKIAGEERFCPRCGRAVEQPLPQTSLHPVAEEPAVEVPAAPAGEGTPLSAYEPPRKRKKRIGLVITAVSMALILAVGGLLAWWLLRSPKGDDSMYLLRCQKSYTEDGLCYGIVEYEYDARGNLIRVKSEKNETEQDGQKIYGELTGEYDSIVEYQYDENNHLIGIVRSGDRASGSRVEYEVEDGRITGIRRVDTAANGKETVKQYFVTYSDGRITDVKIQKKNGLEDYYQVIYDDQGRVVEEFFHENSWIKYAYDYDSNGRLQRVKQYGKDFAGGGWSEWLLRFLAEYQYDKKGNLIRVNKEDFAGGDDSLRLEYNSKDKLTTTSLYEDGELREVYTYKYEGDGISGGSYTEYDAQGNALVLRLIYDGNGNLEEYYDKTGGYTKYEYRRLALSKEDAQRIRRYNETTERSDLSKDLYGTSYDHYTPFFGYYLIPTPLDPAYGTGPLFR